MTQTAKWAWQDSAGDWCETHANDSFDTESQVVFQESRHQRAGKAPHVIPIVDVQRRRLTAGQEQQAVVQGGQIRDATTRKPPGCRTRRTSRKVGTTFFSVTRSRFQTTR